MKLSLAFLALVYCVVANAAELSLLQKWEDFKRTHGKTYENHNEELLRLQIWNSNLEYIERHNKEADAGKHTFWLKMNKFGDLQTHEFARLYNGYNYTMRSVNTQRTYYQVPADFQAPDSVDWRTQGYVTDVKDQGQCGSCWSFSATGSLEGQWFKKTGKLVSLSEQNLVDCSRAQGNMGCNGGLMDQAFAYVKTNNGIDTEASYPYEAEDGDCRFNSANVGATDTGFTDVKSKDESALQDAVASVGPISVAIDASHTSFQFYSHGVYHEFLCSQTRLDHGVLAVGYGSQSNKAYWIVKNSWGSSWGDKGYILMSRNRNNNCGIATAASFPTV